MTSTSATTILFTDVVGSVELRTKHGDESAHQMMRAHFDLVRPYIERYSGQEVKTIGDSFMVAFGSPQNAVDCAVAVQRALAEHNLKAPGEQILVRMGLNTGEAIQEEGDLFGSTVDAASRIMSKAAGEQILLSEHTRGVIGAAKELELIDRGPFWLKGFPERWRLYEVLWHEEKISTAAVLLHIGHRTPFVGRESERADLRRCLDAARAGHGSLVMIGGEPGVGKTRITEELAAEADRHGFLTLTGHCYEMEGAPPYIPFVEIIESAARIIEPGALLARLGADAPEVAKLVPELRERFPDIATPKQLPPEQERRRMFNGIVEFTARATQSQPLLLVIEDLHWTDEPTLLLLQHFSQRLHEMPVLMVGTYRDTELDVARSLAKALEELLRQRLAHDMLLKRLPQGGVTAMLTGRSGLEPPARLVKAIYKETEGNPFFVEEVFKHFAEEGKLFDAAGQWQADLEIDELDVPRGVLLVIGHRLNRVNEECRRILTTAAVIGRTFGFQLLDELLDLDEDTVFDAMDEVERAQLIRSTAGGGEAQLMFSHELIRQTLLNSLSTPRRQRLHLRVAEALERLYPENLEQRAADLAYHYYQAGGNANKVIEYAVMAAERATAQTAYEEAVDQYERALHALESKQPIDELRLCNLLLELGRAHGNAGDPDKAKEILLSVTDIARKLPAPEQFAEALLEISRFWYSGGITDNPLIKLMNEGLALLSKEDSALRASVMGRLSFLLEFPADERRVALSEEAIAMARRVGDPKALYYALDGKGWVWDLPLEKRIAAAAELAELEEKIGSPDGMWRGLYLLSHLYREQGEIAASDAALSAYKTHAAETLHPTLLWYSTVIEATRAHMMGRLEEAEQLTLESLPLGLKVNDVSAGETSGVLMYTIRLLQGRLDEIDEVFRGQAELYPDVPMYHSGVAYLHLYLGREEQAREELEYLAANDFVDLPRNFGLPIILVQMGEVAAALGDTRRAALLYNLLNPLSDRLFTVAYNVVCLGSIAHWLGLLAGSLKRWDTAIAHFEAALETNARVGARPFLARTQHEYARMLIERNDTGDRDKARALLHEAIPTYREIGMPTFLKNAEELMAKL